MFVVETMRHGVVVAGIAVEGVVGVAVVVVDVVVFGVDERVVLKNVAFEVIVVVVVVDGHYRGSCER